MIYVICYRCISCLCKVYKKATMFALQNLMDVFFRRCILSTRLHCSSIVIIIFFIFYVLQIDFHHIGFISFLVVYLSSYWLLYCGSKSSSSHFVKDLNSCHQTYNCIKSHQISSIEFTCIFLCRCLLFDERVC